MIFECYAKEKIKRSFLFCITSRLALSLCKNPGYRNEIDDRRRHNEELAFDSSYKQTIDYGLVFFRYDR